MLNPNRLLRVMIELIFMAAGGMLLWVAWTGRFLFNPRRPAWLVLSALLILWGLRRWQRGRAASSPGMRMVEASGGISLALAGLLMFSLGWAPFRYADWLLGAAGALFVLRGLVAIGLVTAGR